MKVLSFFIALLLVHLSLSAQKVATYSTGNPGQADYESFAFWTKEDGNRSFITYNYGADRKEAKITYAGIGNYKGIQSFKIQFTNKLTLHVMRNGPQLHIVDNEGKYNKAFKWEYEGPVNGIGTFCNVCASDQVEATSIVDLFYQ